MSVTRVCAQQERESKTAGGPAAETVAERLVPNLLRLVMRRYDLFPRRSVDCF